MYCILYSCVRLYV